MVFVFIHTCHMGPFSTVLCMFAFDRGRSSMQTCTHTQKHACKRRNNAKTPDLRGADRHHCSMPTIVGARPNPREDRHVRVAAHRTRPSERITAKKQASLADDALSRVRTFKRSPYASFPLPVCTNFLHAFFRVRHVPGKITDLFCYFNRNAHGRGGPGGGCGPCALTCAIMSRWNA